MAEQPLDDMDKGSTNGEEGNSDDLQSTYRYNVFEQRLNGKPPWCCKEGNSDLFGQPIDVAQNGNSADQDGLMLESLNEALAVLQHPDWQGLNTNFDCLPQMHQHATLALSSTDAGALKHGRRLHIYTDGACRKGKAAWAFVVLRQSEKNGRAIFCRIGFAAGVINWSHVR